MRTPCELRTGVVGRTAEAARGAGTGIDVLSMHRISGNTYTCR